MIRFTITETNRPITRPAMLFEKPSKKAQAADNLTSAPPSLFPLTIAQINNTPPIAKPLKSIIGISESVTPMKPVMNIKTEMKSLTLCV